MHFPFDYIFICLASFTVSSLALFSGFGIGTILMPIFALFFPLPLAIASTAVVHLVNNLFKAILVGHLANKEATIKFGIPAGVASAIGAYILGSIIQIPPLTSYTINEHHFSITAVGLAVGTLIVISALFDLIPKLSQLSFSRKYLPIGGFISGLFGGISGHQGMFRSAFLIKAGLTKEAFIGTGVICSIIVDFIRIPIYGWEIYTNKFKDLFSNEMPGVIFAASLSAIAGSILGVLFLDKVTYKSIRILVGSFLLIAGLVIAIGML